MIVYHRSRSSSSSSTLLIGRQERRRFFDISIASIAETAAAVDIMLAYRLILESEAAAIKADLNIAYAMLINLKRSAI